VHVTSSAFSFPTTQFRHPAGQFVISGPRAWNAAWTDAGFDTAKLPLPVVDFSNDVVLLTSMGPEPSGGYFTSFRSVTTGTSGRLLVAIGTVAPGCGAITIVTYPADAILIPRALARVVDDQVTPSVRGCPPSLALFEAK
jgi:hypothetical protein